MQAYQKGKVYSFVVTAERNAKGCQIVQDSQGVKHLVTGAMRTFPVGKTIRLEVRGFSHSPSEITGCYYMILSPKAKKEISKTKEPFSGKYLAPRKRKMTGFGPKFLRKHYSVGKRYLFVVIDEKDGKGRQFVEDSFGIKHLLTGTVTEYLPGENVRCTVLDIPQQQNTQTGDYFLILSLPRVVNKERVVRKYIKSPQQWSLEVQGLDKHQSGKPFNCACCGLDFPGRMGYRVDLKDIYFCKSCASKIFVPKERRKEPALIYKPMGNKR